MFRPRLKLRPQPPGDNLLKNLTYLRDELTHLLINMFSPLMQGDGPRGLIEDCHVQPNSEEISCTRANALSRGAAESLPISQSPPLAPQAAKILIVDDDPVTRSLMQDTLEDDGFAVVEAVDGVEALGRCQEGVPLLVIVDALMPKMDGFELCQRLRHDASTKHLPILMATGLEDDASVARAYEAGATDFISKPLNWLILGHRVRYMLRGARVLDDLRENQAASKPHRNKSTDRTNGFRPPSATCRKASACSVPTSG